jgi:hypothetical protein
VTYGEVPSGGPPLHSAKDKSLEPLNSINLNRWRSGGPASSGAATEHATGSSAGGCGQSPGRRRHASTGESLSRLLRGNRLAIGGGIKARRVLGGSLLSVTIGQGSDNGELASFELNAPAANGAIGAGLFEEVDGEALPTGVAAFGAKNGC